MRRYAAGRLDTAATICHAAVCRLAGFPRGGHDLESERGERLVVGRVALDRIGALTPMLR